MSASRWTENELERLRKLASAGLSSSQIAREMKRSVSTVRAQAKKWDIAVALDVGGLAKNRRLVELGLKARK